MIHRIGLSAVPAENRQLAIAAADFSAQGQWGYLSGTDSGENEPEVTPVSSYAIAQYNKEILAPVCKEPATNEDVIADVAISDGDRVLRIMGAGNLLEDTELGDYANGDFSSATPGDAMVLTVSGFPTLDGASDDPGASATVVARFEKYIAPSVWYRTV